jgi:hypothetical protein
MPLDTPRNTLVSLALRDCHEQQDITYREVRPIPVEAYKAERWPIVTDCSGWYECLCYAAGLPDPFGMAYAGAATGGCEGNTASMLSHMPHTTRVACFPGDAVVFGAFPGVHAAVFLQRGNLGNPLMGSNGRPQDPVELPLSELVAAFPGRAVTYLKLPEPDTFADRWRVRDMRGRLVATTEHPAIWSARHTHAFRDHGELAFYKEVSK